MQRLFSAPPALPLISQRLASLSPAPTACKGRESQIKPGVMNSRPNCSSGLMGRRISAKMKERTSKGMPPFFIELGDELVIVYRGCVILGLRNGINHINHSSLVGARLRRGPRISVKSCSSNTGRKNTLVFKRPGVHSGLFIICCRAKAFLQLGLR